jgi:hypothetical protein
MWTGMRVALPPFVDVRKHPEGCALEFCPVRLLREKEKEKEKEGQDNGGEWVQGAGVDGDGKGSTGGDTHSAALAFTGNGSVVAGEQLQHGVSVPNVVPQASVAAGQGFDIGALYRQVFGGGV